MRHSHLRSSVHRTWTYVSAFLRLTCVEKIQVYLPKEELDASRTVAKTSGRSVAELVREAIRSVVLKPTLTGPVAIWDGIPKRTSLDHDVVQDNL
jgi:hypothetical protein